MDTQHTVRDLATVRHLWDEYIDPTGEGDPTDDFNTMITQAKMAMIVDLWPLDVDDDDDEGQALLHQRAADPTAFSQSY